MPSNYPPGVTDQNFDELCWGETYRLGRSCIVCHEPLPDQADDELCDANRNQVYFNCDYCGKMSEVRLEFGIFAEPLVVQLENQGFRFKSEKDEKRFQRLLHAWNMLRVHGIQTDGESQKSSKRLMKSILETIEPTEVTNHA